MDGEGVFLFHGGEVAIFISKNCELALLVADSTCITQRLRSVRACTPKWSFSVSTMDAAELEEGISDLAHDGKGW